MEDLVPALEKWSHGNVEEVVAAATAAIGLLYVIEAEETDVAVDADALAEVCLRRILPDTGRAVWGGFERARWQSAMQEFRPEKAADCWRRLLPRWRELMRGLDAEHVPVTREPRLRLEVGVQYMGDESASRSYQWLSRVLLGPGSELDSLFVRWWLNTKGPRVSRERTGWHWPLRIGFLPEERSRALREEFLDRNRSWFQDLVDAYLLTGGVETCDLLVSPLSVAETVAALRSVRGHTTALLLLGPEIEATAQAFVELAELRAISRASVLMSCARPPEPANLVVKLVEELSHNEPLDTAVCVATQTKGRSTPLIIGERSVIERTRIAVWGDRVAGLLARRGVADQAANLRRSIPRMVFESERGDATEIARWTRFLDGQTDFIQARYLQAKIYHPREKDAAEAPPASRFVAGRWHLVESFIGPWRRSDSTASSEAFPEDEVGYSGGVEELTIALAARGCSVALLDPRPPWEVLRLREEELIPKGEGAGEAASSRIRLWPSGRSETVWFALRPERAGRVDARLLVAHNNRILQTGLLSAEAIEATEGLAETRDEPPFVPLVVEGLTRTDLVELDDRGTSDAALLLNRSGDGLPGLTSLSGVRVKIGDFTQGAQVADTIRVELEAMVASPEDFEVADSEALRKTLVRLALEGTRLYRRLVIDEGLEGRIGKPGSRIQLVAAKPESWLPLEFVYDGEAPEDNAQLCPNRTAALEQGSCAECEHAESEDYVCPARFWGLNRVIERHMYDPKNRPAQDHAVVGARLTVRPRIFRPRKALFAHHDRAGKFTGGRQVLAEVELALEQATESGAARVDTWPKWIGEVDRDEPGLLVVLPHTDIGPDGIELRIADGSDASLHRLVDVRIKRSHVGKPPPKVVFLLGCDTSDVKCAYSSFPAAFRHAGASVVIATLTSVLGRHATPVAKKLVDEFGAYWSSARDPATVGMALTAVRRNLLAAGLPFGMVLVAYGDADWVLG